MQISQQKIVLRCSAKTHGQWAAALSFYHVAFASKELPLEKELNRAAADQTDLFVIIDDPQESDEQLISALRAYMETEERPASRMRIAFVASRTRFSAFS